MKNVITHLVIASFVGIPCLFAAEFVGLVPSLPFSPVALLGGYFVGGLLALACHDYRRASERPLPRVRRAASPRPAAQPVAPRHWFAWHHHAVSA